MQGETLMTYEFKLEPYKHQREIFEATWQKHWYAFFLEMGTGKSKIAIDTMGALFENGDIDTALIIAPKGVYDNWVKKEMPTHLPDRIDCRVVRWNPSFTKGFRESLTKIAVPDQREEKTLSILVMNVEALSTGKGSESAVKYLSLNPNNLVIVDESTTIKTHTAKRTKNALRIARQAKYRRILTGSPITKDPMDLYSQCDFLSSNALGFKSYYSFRARYAVLVKQHKKGGGHFPMVVGFRNLEELGKKLDKFSSRVLKKDCLDLPEKIYLRREVPLTTEQNKLYVQMREMALAKIRDGILTTTNNILTQIMRLQQITCGFVQPDDGPIEPIKNNRVQELLDILQETSGKVIIWASFTYDIHRIHSELSSAYGSDSVAMYYGGTPQDERQKIVEQFQDESSPLQYFVGQPATAGFGITLTAAHTVVYYSNTYDLEKRVQSEDRAHRIGQNTAVTYIDIVSPNTVDERVLEALTKKDKTASKVLGEEFKTWISEPKLL
jgi:SNF2 family DNA or RNA helicase